MCIVWDLWFGDVERKPSSGLLRVVGGFQCVEKLHGVALVVHGCDHLIEQRGNTEVGVLTVGKRGAVSGVILLLIEAYCLFLIWRVGD